MARKPSPGFRIRIVESNGYATYLVRYEGNSSVQYMSGSETPLALSNLILDRAAELRFKLEDAIDGHEAATIVRDTLDKQFVNNKPITPKVTLLT